MSKRERILALDIGASSVKLAEFQGSKAGGLQLERYVVGSLGLDPQSDDDRSRYIVSTLRELLASEGIKPGPVVLSVSGQSVFSRFVKLPPVEPEKVHQIVQYEAQQNVPFPINEVVWDYQLIGGASGEVDVMLAAIKADIIEDITDCVGFSGLRPELIDVAPMALYNAVRYNYPNLQGCTLIVDIGARSTDLVFLEEGRVFSRSIPVAGNAITQQIMREFDLPFFEAEDLKVAHGFVAFGGAYESPSSEVADKVSKTIRSVMTRMHAEINRSINFYRSQQSGSQPSLILLTGGSSVIPYTDTFLREKLKVDVEYLNPFNNVAVSETISAEQIGNSAHLLGESVGLALRKVLTCPIELDLMPPKVAEDKAFQRKQPVLLAAMFGLVLVIAIWCGFFYKMGSIAKERLSESQARLVELRRLQGQMQVPMTAIEATEKKFALIGELIADRSSWLEILELVRKELPEGMWVAHVRPLLDDPSATASLTFDEDLMEFSGQVGAGGGATQREVSGPPAVRKIEIAGFGYTDKITTARPITELADRLRLIESHFTPSTAVTLAPRPAPGEYTREFKIEIGLKRPIRL